MSESPDYRQLNKMLNKEVVNTTLIKHRKKSYSTLPNEKIARSIHINKTILKYVKFQT